VEKHGRRCRNIPRFRIERVGRRDAMTPPTVALAILTSGNGYALQLRDDVPTIASPGR